MTIVPAVDPIPLPAPVWLFKLLHQVTLILHFAAVDLLLGGLALGILLAVLGRMRNKPHWIQVSGMITRRLPTVMAYVVNLGIPPLLFAQVLYGRALYTSSVLIGAYWISVILLLTLSYFGLYIAASRAEKGRDWTSASLAVLLLAGTIGFIYSNNMTLMLRPEVWSAMYQAHPGGVQLNLSDPVLLARYHFFVFGAFPVAGTALVLLSLRGGLTEGVRSTMRRWGGAAMLLMVPVQAACAFVTVRSLPAGVWSKMMGDALYSPFFYAWCATAAMLAIAGLANLAVKSSGVLLAGAGVLAAFLNATSIVMVRDGIRDYTLRTAGFEVWDRHVVTNWSVVGLFLLLFVVSIGVIVMLAVIVAKAKRIEEKYA